VNEFFVVKVNAFEIIKKKICDVSKRKQGFELFPQSKKKEKLMLKGKQNST
jgi:hypothetical protein